MQRLLHYAALVLSLAGCEKPKTASASSGGEILARPDANLPRDIAADSTLAAADAALRAGHPWQTTQLLAPVLRDPARRTPAAILLAARAAAGWEGWDQVEKLLATEPWIDRYNGDARELLARAALERNEDTLALANAAAAVARAADARTRAIRLVLLARALDRGNQRDSARATYLRAASGLRDAADWLRLRAAGLDPDSSDRARLYAAVSVPAARARIAWTEAQALERTGNLAGAATRYAVLGAMVPAFRLRASMPSDPAAHSRLRSDIISYVRTNAGTGDARTAVELLDKYFAPLSPAEELVVARSAAASGPLARALTAYSRAEAAGPIDAADMLQYGELLARAGRYRDAQGQFDSIPANSPYAGRAAYQHARAALSSGNGADAANELRAVAAKFAADTSAAPAALYLLADLATDDGRDADARTLFRQLASQYPNNGRAPDALFHAGIIAFVQGDDARAAVELDSVAELHPQSRDAVASRYWSGRAWAAAGKDSAARARWRAVATDDPLSYYASASAKRLGEQPWAPASAPDSVRHVASVDAAVRRMTLLEQLGMDIEARFEADGIEHAADGSAADLLAAAAALRDHGEPSRAARLASRALERGAPKDARTYRLIYPLLDRDVLLAQAKAHGLDPALVAGLIRQESSFNPHATSVAGARGLMQVLPSVGQQVAQNLRFPLWEPVLLYEPDANLQIGTAHLASAVQQYGAIVRVLAAYNAGGSRAERWASKAGVADAEVYAERIPFTETRDYVRIVQRNAELYRDLYNLGR